MPKVSTPVLGHTIALDSLQVSPQEDKLDYFPRCYNWSPAVKFLENEQLQVINFAFILVTFAERTGKDFIDSSRCRLSS